MKNENQNENHIRKILKIKILLLILICFILLFLSIKLSKESIKYNCNECYVNFKSNIAGLDYNDNNYYKEWNINLNELYDGLIHNNSCIIKWNKIDGWVKI
jgi:ABC-type oligopeptide transport system substrate-binding subunit